MQVAAFIAVELFHKKLCKRNSFGSGNGLTGGTATFRSATSQMRFSQCCLALASRADAAPNLFR